jgi:transposase
MNTTSADLPLPVDPTPPSPTFLNPHLWFVDQDGYRVIFARHEPIYRFALNDKPHLRFVAVMLRQSQLATQPELAQAFGHSVATQRRWEQHFLQHGLDGLTNPSPSGRLPKVDRTQEHFVRRWFQQGLSLADMARRLGVGTTTVHRTCQRLGLHRQPTAAPELPLDPSPPLPSTPVSAVPDPLPPAAPASPAPRPLSPATDVLLPAASQSTPPARPPHASHDAAAESLPAHDLAEPLSVVTQAVPTNPDPSGPHSKPLSTSGPAEELPTTFTLDQDPTNRQGDRFLAQQGLLADAVPLFANVDHLPRLGVLLAIPVLVAQGVLGVFQAVYGSLCPSFYGLRTLVVTLVLLALLRIKRPENLKEYAPDDLGRLLGLDRAPEVKTVRRKVAELARRQRGPALQQALAQQRIAQQDEAVAWLYIAGHVREYHGKEPLAKTKKAQSPVARPAATDTWVNDAAGLPLLVVTSPMNAALTQVLQPILEEVKGLVPAGVRPTVIFDRGGFSPRLFRWVIDNGFDVITYRKGKQRRVSRQRFTEQQVTVDGRCLRYQLYDQPRVRVGRLRRAKQVSAGAQTSQYLWLRQVTVLRDDGGQTQAVTNRTDLSGALVLYYLFNRWRQENFFKYMAEEFALDALVEYGAEEVPAGLDRPNPKRRLVEKQLRQARAEVVRLQAAWGEAATRNEEEKRPTMRGFKVAHADLRRELADAEQRVQRLVTRRQRLPKRIAATEVKALRTEKKLVVDAIKMSAYQIETELLGMLGEDYARAADEGRTLLQAAFQSCGRLEVRDNELWVTLAAQSSAHRTEALRALCAKLNVLEACFPGTTLRIRLGVEAHQPLIP